MRIDEQRVVVITGATAGVGRAISRLFAHGGASVALLARDPQRLETTRQELERLGGRAIAIPTDVADPEQVEAAADRVERELGPIDIWVNCAMATMVSPMSGISVAEFRRVTEVTYLGTVWGTMAALRRMRPRDRGTVIQVGSALAYRAIPLQAPYCGAKHAARGFTESVRTELLHDRSQVHITMVELPAVNTPQFDWCRTTLQRQPQPVGTVYEPEVIARAVVWAARKRRREVYVTHGAALAIWADKIFPGLLDRCLARKGVKAQQSEEPVSPGRPDNLWAPVPGDFAARGRFSDRARPHSASLWLTMNRQWVLLAGLLAAAAWRATQSRRRPIR